MTIAEIMQKFLDNSFSTILNTDPTNSLQRNLRKKINRFQNPYPKRRWKHYNQNSTAPTINGLIKYHKHNNPIRAIVNCQNAPAYKLAKYLTNNLKTNLPFPYTPNIKNIKQQLFNIQEIPFDGKLKFASFSINMYVNA